MPYGDRNSLKIDLFQNLAHLKGYSSTCHLVSVSLTC